MSIEQQFQNLDPDVQNKFYRVSVNDPEGRTAMEWFEHLVPEELRDSSQETEVFMDGGTVTQEVWVQDQGMANGHYETVEFEIDDRDVSRIESGHNGGEYTHDNTIMEDSSINRARGSENMSPEEFDAAEAANSTDVQLINDSMESTETLTTAATDSSEIFADAMGSVFEVAIAGIAAYKVGEYVHNNLPEDWDDSDKVMTTGAAGIGAALLTFTPPGQLIIGTVAIYKLARLGYKVVRKYA